MSRVPALLCSLALLALPARAAEPDAEWEDFPAGADSRADALPESTRSPQEPESPARAAWRLRVRALSAGLPSPPLVVERLGAEPPGLSRTAAPPPSLPPPLEPAATLLGGRPLADAQWGGAAWVGLPTVGLRLHRGLGAGWDVGLGYGGLYGQSNELSVHVRRGLSEGETEWALGLEGSVAWFGVRPSAPPSGARALTGRRNFNLAPTLHVSRHAPLASVRWVGQVQLLLTLDTEPVALSPLGGVPPAVSLGWNVPVLGGGEWALGRHAVFQLLGGFEVHGRTGDTPFMPVLRLGVLFGT
ncbi:MAG: hypothetical protein RL653_409 [Pseudomonadota bacterium]|jgi:hypothetical protein